MTSEIAFTAWEGLNIACRLAVALIVVVKLTWLFDLYRPIERIGLGVAGGCALMSGAVLVQGPGSPFSEWAGAAFAFGVLLYFIGRLQRQIDHWRANRRQLAEVMRRRSGLPRQPGS